MGFRAGVFGHAQGLQPLVDDVQILVLAERVETHPQTKTFGQGNFFFNHFSWMHFAVFGVGVAQVVLHVLGQQVSAVAGGVNQHIG